MARKQIRNRHLLLLDIVLLSVSPWLVYALRFEGWDWGPDHTRTALVYVSLMVPLRIFIYASFGLYSRMWAYASVRELELIFVAGLAGSAAAIPLGLWILPGSGLAPVQVPMSVLFTNSLLSLGVLAAPRLLLRMRGAARRRRFSGERLRVLIAGAGSAGHMLARELEANPQIGLEPVGFLDDDVSKHGLWLSGLRVLGSTTEAVRFIAQYGIEEVAIAMPQAPVDVVRRVVRAALQAGVRARTIPGFYEIVSGTKTAGQLRDIQIEDLLRRDPVSGDLGAVSMLVSNETVMVTGAGGSIGSELARQIAQLSPKRLLLLGHGENPIFHIQNELRETHPTVDVIPVIADVRDRRRIFGICARYRPAAIFHAAAHKHVPLMEENVIESITNNVKGTQNLVHAALAADVPTFVLISTDKAVRPTNVMGATKRCAEHIVRAAAESHGRNYVAVRFGNVLGSQGSVVPTFMEQIRRGGPVTVTHPEMRRYFMTIPEAVQLVLHSATLGRGGELFVLDMGEPVKIVDLASDLIRLSGYQVGTDIQIKFTGVRPGEKLYEELFFSQENASPTSHPKILCGRDPVEPWGMQLIDDMIRATIEDDCEGEDLRARLKTIVPDYAWTSADESAAQPLQVPSEAGYPFTTPETNLAKRTSDKTKRISRERMAEVLRPAPSDLLS